MFKRVDSFPDFGFSKEDFPNLPKIDGNAKITIDAFVGKNTNLIATLLISACARSGEWRMITITEFSEMINEAIFAIPQEWQSGVIYEIITLSNQELLKSFSFERKDYIMLTPTFARKCLSGYK